MSLPRAATDTTPPRAGVAATAAVDTNINSSNAAIRPNNNKNNSINNNDSNINSSFVHRAAKMELNQSVRNSENDTVKEFNQYLESSIDDDPTGFRSTASSPQKDAVIYADQDTSVVIDVVPSPSRNHTPSPVSQRSATNTPLTLTTLKRSNDQATEKIKVQGTHDAHILLAADTSS